MNNSVFKELWYKMIHSGSRLNLFIGINILVFLALGAMRVFEFLFTRSVELTNLSANFLSVPAYLPSLAYKFYTPFTYMFSHTDFFHILFNMLTFYWFGRILEDFTTSRQFTFIYIAGGLAGAWFFIAAYHTFPAFNDSIRFATLIGASAGVMAIVFAAATLVPEFTLSLLLIGPVKLKYLALAIALIDFISIGFSNPGGSISHLGGALLGFVYIKQLQAGNDWSKIFKKRTRMKIVRPEKRTKPAVSAALPDQDVIDGILDKISKSGYESLTKQEKEQLFKASNKQ
jgi:membrane associated rhomboid family serine protease